jgi:hypothetical protein
VKIRFFQIAKALLVTAVLFSVCIVRSSATAFSGNASQPAAVPFSPALTSITSPPPSSNVLRCVKVAVLSLMSLIGFQSAFALWRTPLPSLEVVSAVNQTVYQSSDMIISPDYAQCNEMAHLNFGILQCEWHFVFSINAMDMLVFLEYQYQVVRNFPFFTFFLFCCMLLDMKLRVEPH